MARRPGRERGIFKKDHEKNRKAFEKGHEELIQKGLFEEVFKGFDRFKDPQFKKRVYTRLERDIQKVLMKEIKGKGVSTLGMDLGVCAQGVSRVLMEQYAQPTQINKEAERLVAGRRLRGLSTNKVNEVKEMEKKVWQSKLEAVDDALFSFGQILKNETSSMSNLKWAVEEILNKLSHVKRLKNYEAIVSRDQMDEKMRSVLNYFSEVKRHFNEQNKGKALYSLTALSLELKEVDLAEEIIKERENLPTI